KKTTRLSPVKVLTIWVEARTQGPKQALLTRWQDPISESCSVVTDASVDVERAKLPAGWEIHTGLEVRQQIVPNATPRLQIVIFNQPPDGASRLTLRLKGEPVGAFEKEVKLMIPRSAWSK